MAGLLTKIAGNEQVQQAVIEKGIEVAGKLVDKQLKNIEEAQEKASDFLKKEVSIPIPGLVNIKSGGKMKKKSWSHCSKLFHSEQQWLMRNGKM